MEQVFISCIGKEVGKAEHKLVMSAEMNMKSTKGI